MTNQINMGTIRQQRFPALPNNVFVDVFWKDRKEGIFISLNFTPTRQTLEIFTLIVIIVTPFPLRTAMPFEQ